MSTFTLKEFNTFLKRVLKGKTYKPITTSNVFDGGSEECEFPYYVDFLNLFCLFNNIRNGVHLDQIQGAGDYSVIGNYEEEDEEEDNEEKDNEDEEDEEEDGDWDETMDGRITIKHEDNTFTDELLTELTKLSMTRFPWIKFNKHHELTIWNTDKVPNKAALHSWAFEGDGNKGEDSKYWKNNALLLGNDAGYPTYTTNSENAGRWVLSLLIRIDNVINFPYPMAGGVYDKTVEGDLDSIHQIKAFLETLIGRHLYHPDGKDVCLDSVELKY